MSVRRLSWRQDYEGRHPGDSQEQPDPRDRRRHQEGSQDPGLAKLRRGDHPQAGEARAMSDIVERLRQVQGDNADVREAAAKIERLRATLKEAAMLIEATVLYYPAIAYKPRLEACLLEARADMRDDATYVVDTIASLRAEIERLRAALQALHDWNVEYARINNLFNGDGTPATFHELLQARAALETKP
jgi:hypothetical protein